MFADPAWLWALILLLPLLGLRIWAQLSSQRSLQGLVATRLHPLLVSRTSQLRHWMAFLFLFLGLTFVILALARPRWGYEEVQSFSQGRSMILAIDTSRSMLAKDLKPNRLERAKLAAKDIVTEMNGDRIGLIAFAGKAFLQAPLTTDHLAVNEILDQIDTELIPRGGTNLSSAVDLALESFRESDTRQKALILFSDGEALEGQEQVAALKKRASNEAMMILTIGVGTENGSIIPELGANGKTRDGVFVRDSNGQVVRSRLDAVALRALATGGGRYIQLGDRASLTRVVKSITDNLETASEEQEVQKRPIERFMWPLGIGVFFLIASHLTHLLFLYFGRDERANSPGSIPMASKAVSPAIVVLITLSFSSLLSDAKEDAWRLIEQENFASAVRVFETELKSTKLTDRERTSLNMGMGSAAFRLGNYSIACEAYGKALIQPAKRSRELAHYNLGNTLFRMGEKTLNPGGNGNNPDNPVPLEADPAAIETTLIQWISAVEHYEAALVINPNNADARHNVEVVKKKILLLEQFKPPPPEESSQETGENEQQQDQDQQQQDQDQQQPQDQDQDQQGEQQGEQPPEGSNESSDSDQPSESESESEQGDTEDEESGQSNQGEPQQAEPNSGGEQEEEQEVIQGQLSANESEPSADQLREQMNNQRVNPETGYSPAEARQRIETLADENGKLRPEYPNPQHGEVFKNW